MAHAPPAVAIAVVSWNTRGPLGDCLRSLEPELRAGRAEVWVVDNASSDGSAALVRERFPWAQLIAAERNLGFGAAVNLVAQRTTTPWIACANADAAPAPGALPALLQAGAADPGAGAVAPRLRLADGSTQQSVHPFPSIPLAVVLSLGLHRLSPRLGDALCIEHFWDADRPRRVAWAMGAFLLVRRAAWEQVGGFDPYQWMYAEDLALGWRLARAGWATRFVPQAVVEHRGEAATHAAFGDRRAARKHASTYGWLLRERGRVVARLVAGLHVAGAAVRVAGLTPLAAARPRRYGPLRHEWAGWARRHQLGLRPRRSLERHR